MNDYIKDIEPTDHRHRYYFAQIKYDFEPLPEGNNLYRRVEYSYSVCNCGRAIKSKVINKENE